MSSGISTAISTRMAEQFLVPFKRKIYVKSPACEQQIVNFFLTFAIYFYFLLIYISHSVGVSQFKWFIQFITALMELKRRHRLFFFFYLFHLIEQNLKTGIIHLLVIVTPDKKAACPTINPHHFV